jgi:hypothetical protein
MELESASKRLKNQQIRKEEKLLHLKDVNRTHHKILQKLGNKKI